MAVGVIADHRLEERAGELIGRGNLPDLREAEPEAVLEQREQGRKYGLKNVVSEMRETDRKQDANERLFGSRCGRRCGRIGHSLLCAVYLAQRKRIAQTILTLYRAAERNNLDWAH